MTGPKRIQRSRAKGWRQPHAAVYVGRPSRWGNPFIVGETYLTSEILAPSRIPTWRDPGEYYGIVVERCPDVETAIRWYSERIEAIDPDWLGPLRDRDLVCWCPLDQPCHADVLLELANA